MNNVEVLALILKSTLERVESLEKEVDRLKGNVETEK